MTPHVDAAASDHATQPAHPLKLLALAFLLILGLPIVILVVIARLAAEKR